MEFVYTTDLHGNKQKYEDVFNFAKEHKVKLIHLGADLLPKGSDMLKLQKSFVRIYLRSYFLKCKDEGIDVIGFFGNDDAYSRKKFFREYATLLDETTYMRDGYNFLAYGYVQDYKFGLKSACKWDSPDWRCPEPYISEPIEFTDEGRLVITDVEDYFRKKGTIEGDLQQIHASRKTIMAIHQPPHNIDLDVCLRVKEVNGRRIFYEYPVGSKAVYDFIAREKPLLVLCGHIHENLEATSVWQANIGKTVVIQPGQNRERTTVVHVAVEEETVTANLVIL